MDLSCWYSEPSSLSSPFPDAVLATQESKLNYPKLYGSVTSKKVLPYLFRRKAPSLSQYHCRRANTNTGHAACKHALPLHFIVCELFQCLSQSKCLLGITFGDQDNELPDNTSEALQLVYCEGKKFFSLYIFCPISSLLSPWTSRCTFIVSGIKRKIDPFFIYFKCSLHSYI